MPPTAPSQPWPPRPILPVRPLLDANPDISYDISSVISYEITESPMCNSRDDWGFGSGFPFGGRFWAGAFGPGSGPRSQRRRSQMFESGEV